MKTKLLKQSEYEQFVRTLVPPDWKIVWVKFIQKNGEDANGICKHNEKTIKLVWKKSLYHEDLARTIIHEAVHVQLGKDKLGHDKEFWMLYESLLKVYAYFVYQDVIPNVTKDTEQLVVYHGTSTRHLKRILKEGLEPRKDKKGNWELVSRKGHVYLSIAYPLYFAINTCKSNKDEAVVLKIQMNKDDFNLLYPDEDFIGQIIHQKIGAGNLRMITKMVNVEEYKHHWIDSLTKMGNVSYKGKISTDKIVDYKVVTDKILFMRAIDPTISIMNFYFCGNYYVGMTNSLFRNNQEKDGVN